VEESSTEGLRRHHCFRRMYNWARETEGFLRSQNARADQKKERGTNSAGASGSPTTHAEKWRGRGRTGSKTTITAFIAWNPTWSCKLVLTVEGNPREELEKVSRKKTTEEGEGSLQDGGCLGKGV